MAAPLSKFGDYFLIKKIATGGMAEIHLARTRTARGPEKYVALKMIHPRYMEDGNFHRMIVEEAKIAVQLNHKNIGQVFDLGSVDGRYFIVMEFIDGYDLSRLHDATQDKRIPIPIDVTAFVGREVCAALAYAHALRDRTGRPLCLIHRDISPQNILISFDGEVKIIDFGIAKVSTQLQETQVGVIKGKFYYMSPEQAGARDVDQRSDLFSLGICLWETLCGRSLFRREGGPTNPLAILHEIRTLPIPRVREIRPDCPRDLDDLVAKALARDVSARFQSAVEMQGAFNRFLLNHAPSFERERVCDHMVLAFDKQETTKETDRITTRMADLMQRGEFLPSEHSVIFEVPTGAVDDEEPAAHDVHGASTGMLEVAANDDDTRIFAQRQAARPARIQTVDRMEAPVAGIIVDVQDRTTDRAIPLITSSDLAMSDTVFLRKDDVEEMRRQGAAPQVVDKDGLPTLPAADPNSRTQSLPAKEIQAAHAAYAARLEGRSSDQGGTEEIPKSEPKARSPRPHPIRAAGHRTLRDEPLSRHPLFRLLVIGVLVLCVLTATLALLLVKRARLQDKLQLEQERVIPGRVERVDTLTVRFEDPP